MPRTTETIAPRRTAPDSDLAARVRRHYESRDFRPTAIELLCAEIEARRSPDGLRIDRDRRVAVDRLLAVFEPIEQIPIPATLHPEPAAIFALSFGYRLDKPFAATPTDRSPGRNNGAIAVQVERCHRIFPGARVAVQYEVGLALRIAATRGECEAVLPDLLLPARDWSTAEALRSLVESVSREFEFVNRHVVLATHLHHYGRCAMLLAQAGFEPLIVPKEVGTYADYDVEEAEPRFRSEWEYLLNDFLALCRASSSEHRVADLWTAPAPNGRARDEIRGQR